MIFELQQVLDILITQFGPFVVAGLGLRLEGVSPGVELVIVEIVIDVFFTLWDFLLRVYAFLEVSLLRVDVVLVVIFFSSYHFAHALGFLDPESALEVCHEL